MVWVDIIISIIFIFSFIGGLKQGVVKSIFALLSIIIAIPLTGIFYHLVVDNITFISDENWRNFIGFSATFIITIIILSLIFIIPSKLIENIWKNGIIYSILGGFFSALGFAFSLVLFTTIINKFTILFWLEQILLNSKIIEWLITYLGFIQFLLPEALRISF